MVKEYLLLMSVIFGMVRNQALPDPITLPPDVQDKISDKDILELRNQIVQHFMKKCETNGGANAVSNAQDGYNDLFNCLKSLKITDLAREIEEAKSNGNVTEVYSRHCNRKSDFEKCFNTMLDTTRLCFTDDEKNNFVFAKNITKQITEHMCYNSGERISVFIAEESQHCFMEEELELKKCFGSESQKISAADSIMYLANPISFNKTSCDKTAAVKRCMNDALGKCKQTTIANEVASLFELVRISTPCHIFAVSHNAASSINRTLSTILIPMLTCFMFVFDSYFITKNNNRFNSRNAAFHSGNHLNK